MKIQTGKVTVVSKEAVHEEGEPWEWTEPGQTVDYEIRYEEISYKKYAYIWNVSEDQYQVYPPYGSVCYLDVDFSTEESITKLFTDLLRATNGLESITWTAPLTTIFESN